jgi:hypothetical protein
VGFTVGLLSCGSPAPEPWHIERHEFRGTEAHRAEAFVDCRGSNMLQWQVLETTGRRGTPGFTEPDKVAVTCAVAELPPEEAAQFPGWGWTRTNWAKVAGRDPAKCAPDVLKHLAERPGASTLCDDYFQARRDGMRVSAPWCLISFQWTAAVTLDFTLATYCYSD